ncbi:MAG: YhfC family glutamic-type intramembrane protease, partial [Clostridium sp.]
MKKYYPVIVGVVSLIIFGLILPQPFTALLVLVESPVKEFIVNHPLLLCIAVGLIQGVSEECGYYWVFNTKLKKYRSPNTALLFGIGRSSLELLYNLIILITLQSSTFNAVLIVVARIIGFGGTIGLSIFDFSAARNNKKYLLG